MDDARVVLITAPDEAVALSIARELVDRRLVACVNVVPGVTSVYRWRGEVLQDREVLCVAKTTRARVPELEAAVIALHPYDVPELVVLAPEHVQPAYLAWLRAESAPE